MITNGQWLFSALDFKHSSGDICVRRLHLQMDFTDKELLEGFYDGSPEAGAEIRRGCFGLSAGFVLVVLVVLLASLFTGCQSPRIIERIRTDTVFTSVRQRDSIFIERVLHDSMSYRRAGDTVFIDRWHDVKVTEYRDRTVHDTFYCSITDTIPVPVPVPVPRELTRWQQARIQLANFVIVALFVALAVWLCKKRRFLKKFLK